MLPARPTAPLPFSNPSTSSSLQLPLLPPRSQVKSLAAARKASRYLPPLLPPPPPQVESLAAARKASSSEPSDAIRAVNALLTQLDALRRFPNVMIL